VLLLLLAQPLWAGIEAFPFADRAQEVRYQKLTSELRCVKCQNNSLADSEGMIAADIRREVFDMVQAGKTDAQIVDFFVVRYGDFVRYMPRFEPLTYVLWLGPLLLLPLGIWWLARSLHARAKQAAIQAEEA